MIERLRVWTWAGVPGEVSSPEFVCWCSFSVCFTPMLLQWHVKDPGHSAKKCWWQVTAKHAYTLDPTKLEWADYAAVWDRIRKSAHTQLCQGTLGRSCLSLLSHCGLILAQRVYLVCTSWSPLKKQQQQKDAQAGNERSNILPKSSQARKKHHHSLLTSTHPFPSFLRKEMAVFPSVNIPILVT